MSYKEAFQNLQKAPFTFNHLVGVLQKQVNEATTPDYDMINLLNDCVKRQKGLEWNYGPKKVLISSKLTSRNTFKVLLKTKTF